MEAESLNQMNPNSPTSATAPPNSGGFFDYDHKKDRLEEVVRLSEAPDFWNAPPAPGTGA